jgi:hypothetical protein
VLIVRTERESAITKKLTNNACIALNFIVFLVVFYIIIIKILLNYDHSV